MHREVSIGELEDEIAKWQRRYDLERGMSIEIDESNRRVLQNMKEMLFEKILFEDVEEECANMK